MPNTEQYRKNVKRQRNHKQWCAWVVAFNGGHYGNTLYKTAVDARMAADKHPNASGIVEVIIRAKLRSNHAGRE